MCFKIVSLCRDNEDLFSATVRRWSVSYWILCPKTFSNKTHFWRINQSSFEWKVLCDTRKHRSGNLRCAYCCLHMMWTFKCVFFSNIALVRISSTYVQSWLDAILLKPVEVWISLVEVNWYMTDGNLEKPSNLILWWLEVHPNCHTLFEPVPKLREFTLFWAYTRMWSSELFKGQPFQLNKCNLYALAVLYTRRDKYTPE